MVQSLCLLYKLYACLFVSYLEMGHYLTSTGCRYVTQNSWPSLQGLSTFWKYPSQKVLRYDIGHSALLRSDV